MAGPGYLILAAASLAVLLACGDGGGRVEVKQPAGCVDGLEPARSAFGPDDVRLGDAVLVNLRAQRRAPWRDLWDRRRRMGVVKLPIVVPAGNTLKLSVPSHARGIVALDYDLDDEPPARVASGPTTVTLSACRGRYPSVGFPGQILVARPVCRVPIDYAHGQARGRLRLSFGRPCRR